MASFVWLRSALVLLGFAIAVECAPFINFPNADGNDIELEEMLDYLLLENKIKILNEKESFHSDGGTTEDAETEGWNRVLATGFRQELADQDLVDTSNFGANSRDNFGVEVETNVMDPENTVDQFKTSKSAMEPKDLENKSKGPASTFNVSKSVTVHVISTETGKALNKSPASDVVSEEHPKKDCSSFSDFIESKLAKSGDPKNQATEDGKDITSTGGEVTAEKKLVSQALVQKIDREESRDVEHPTNGLEELSNSKMRNTHGIKLQFEGKNEVALTAKEINYDSLVTHSNDTNDDIEEEQDLDKVVTQERVMLSKQLQGLARSTNDFENHEQDALKALHRDGLKDFDIEHNDFETVHTLTRLTPISKLAETKQMLTKNEALEKAGKERNTMEDVGAAKTECVEQGMGAEKPSQSTEQTILQDDSTENRDRELGTTDKLPQDIRDDETGVKSVVGKRYVKQVNCVEKTSKSPEEVNSEANVPTDGQDRKVETIVREMAKDMTNTETNDNIASATEVGRQGSKPNVKQVDKGEEEKDVPVSSARDPGHRSADSSLKVGGHTEKITNEGNESSNKIRVQAHSQARADISLEEANIDADKGVNDHQIVFQLMQFLKQMNKELKLGAGSEGVSSKARYDEGPEQMHPNTMGGHPHIKTQGRTDQEANDDDSDDKAYQGKIKDGQEEKEQDIKGAEEVQSNMVHQKADEIDKAPNISNYVKVNEATDKKVGTKTTGMEEGLKYDIVEEASENIQDTNGNAPNAIKQAVPACITPGGSEHPQDVCNKSSGDTNTTEANTIASDTAANKQDGTDSLGMSQDGAQEKSKLKKVNHVKVPVTKAKLQIGLDEKEKTKMTDSEHKFGGVNKDSPDSATTNVDSTLNEVGHQDEVKSIPGDNTGAAETDAGKVGAKPDAGWKIISSDDNGMSNDRSRHEMSGWKLDDTEGGTKDSVTEAVLQNGDMLSKENQEHNTAITAAKPDGVGAAEGKAGDIKCRDGPLEAAGRASGDGTSLKKEVMNEKEGAVTSHQGLAYNNKDSAEQIQGISQVKEKEDGALNKEGAVTDDNHASAAYEFARCDLQANFPYSDSAVKNHVVGLLVFKQKKSGGPMEIKASLYGLDRDGLVDHTVDVHEFGDLSNGCKSTGTRYSGATYSLSGVMGSALRDETSEVRAAWSTTSEGLVGEHSILGRAVVVHAVPHDSGEREESPKLACCNVARSSDATPWI
ncbi:uncharacterized protein LOC110986846 [Acanthaster planci]|uniref:Uncharacterized protein LOC110986846 n=1 Tax=Acanthaster planci TaxID=133434 RepID=A0A8B7ZN31_ACAPL|nr:uncharacterized protein LOC110986846 [Acanthaster planci]